MREKQRESEDPSWWVCNGLRAGMRHNATVWQTVNMPVITDHPTRWAAKTLESTEPPSEAKRCSSWTPVFENKEKGKHIISSFIMFLLASDSKQLLGERMFLHFLIQEISILERCRAVLWLVALILTFSS